MRTTHPVGKGISVPGVYCTACSRVVAAHGTEDWRSCPRCHTRGHFITVERAKEEGRLPRGDA